MNFVGIIAEYDPFHSGHALQLRMLRQRGASTIAVCMSTGVVQRGGVPILPEAVRVRAALAAGADLVVALPAPYANASAEQFAAAGACLQPLPGVQGLPLPPPRFSLLGRGRNLPAEPNERDQREKGGQ